ncbi:sodium/hydrogen exchanger 9B1 isoform X2 [Halyomorpha halys]|uniref:sodium/hydrogen exchanger 9B1 isoform X2 n=1 Tax=Halyomorpha halys TaxID=286706 RepID=UPI0006D52997|nr:sodium/hydrogen exchanger 9B1-like isoform X2 [Halyomorpha halys]
MERFRANFEIVSQIEDFIESPITPENRKKWKNSVLKWSTVILHMALSWSCLYLVVHNEVLPSGGLFQLLILLLCAWMGGEVCKLIKMPPLLGMLIAGILLKTFGFFQFYGVYPDLIVVSRSLALSVILIKAGLGLNPAVLKRLKFTVLRLAVIPCVCEAIGAAVAAKYFNHIPWIWAFLIGFILCPISPAVVIPSLLSLKEKGYGEDKGIATLVIAAASIDDILSISVFGVIMSAIFRPDSSLTWSILQGPLELIGGLAGGCVWGLICGYLGIYDAEWDQSSLLLLGGFAVVVGSHEFGFPGAGPLAAITSAFVANYIWTKHGTVSPEKNRVAENFSKIWTIVQPALFGLIGPEVDFTVIDASLLAQSALIFLLSLVIRMVACVLCLFNIGLRWKEMLFVSVAWIPKATVQAALAPQPLDQLRGQPDHPDLHIAKLLFATAVLAIIVTAPIGSVAISLTGPVLLNKPDKPNKLMDSDNRNNDC